MLDGMWTFLLVGALGAVGAAAAAGTIAALMAHRRTGTWPGSQDGELSRARRWSLYGRAAVGAGVAVWAVATLAERGLLTL